MNRISFFLFALVAACLPAQGREQAIPFSDEIVYLLMVDRFNDGNPVNNYGGYPLPPDATFQERRQAREEHGYDPCDFAFFQGGDFAGVKAKLDYIRQLGVTAIWLTPVMKNKVFSDGSAGYHGYWMLDFTTTDPHFGSEEEFKELVDTAHGLGLKVYLDIVTNHTANVIYYADDDYVFREGPPHPPVVQFSDRDAKSPAWLNDAANYHNLGGYMDSEPGNPLYGASSLRGDFFGLDDLDTRNPVVIQGMIDIYADWIRKYKIDGFRLDTAKHVDMELWRKFSPAMEEAAKEAGIADFRIFGEVSDQPGPDRKPVHGQRFLSEFVHNKAMPSVLDFGFRMAALNFAAESAAPGRLAEFFRDDSWFITPTSSAHDLPTFVSNHDFGRVGFHIMNSQKGKGVENWRKRSELAHALMFFSRGAPTLYYGDEQGFTGAGDGTDKQARQCMFPNMVTQFRCQTMLGAGGAQDRGYFETESPMFRAIRELSGLRASHPALRRGAQIPRLADRDKAGLFAFSRILPDDPVEYVAVFNNSESAEGRLGAVPVASGNGTRFTQIYPPAAWSQPERIVANGTLNVVVPSLSARLYKADSPVPKSDSTPTVRVVLPDADSRKAAEISEVGFTYGKRIPVTAEVSGAVPGRARFYYSDGDDLSLYLGEDTDPPYTVYVDPAALASSGSRDRGVVKVRFETIYGAVCEAESEKGVFAP